MQTASTMPTTLVPIRRRLAATGLAAVLAVTLAACGDDDDTTEASGDESAELTVTDVWARTSAPGQTAGAAYMVITGGPEDDDLVGASVDTTIACVTEIHETVPASEVGDDAGDEPGDEAMGDTGDEGMAMGGEDCPDGETDAGGSSETALGDTADDMADGDTTETTMAAMDGEAGGTTTTAGDDMGGMGGMTMREVAAIPVPAGEEVRLEPGGYHVMLLGLTEPLLAGDTFEIELEFETAGTQTVTAEVRDR